MGRYCLKDLEKEPCSLRRERKKVCLGEKKHVSDEDTCVRFVKCVFASRAFFSSLSDYNRSTKKGF